MSNQSTDGLWGISENISNYQNFIKNNIVPNYASDYKNDNLKLSGNLKIYIEDNIMRLKKKSYIAKNWDKIIIYEYILNLVNFIINYFNNPTKDRLKIIDWYFIDLIINKGKIIIRGIFYDLGLFIEDKILSEGLLELESRINEMNDI